MLRAATGFGLLLCLSGVHSTVVGLDMGSSFIKVGVGRHGHGVQMALNDASKRKTPSAFAFHPEGPRRVWGDDALNLVRPHEVRLDQPPRLQMSRYPGFAVPFPHAFLGRSFANSDDVRLTLRSRSDPVCAA